MMTASADSACLDTAYQTVFVLQNPTVDFSVVLDTCDYTIHTINSSAKADSYRWDISDNSTVYAKDINHYFSNSGIFEISLIASTDSSCVDTLVTTVSIPPLPEPLFDYFSAVCDSVVEFSNESRYSSDYIWEFGDTDTSREEDPFHSYSISGYVPVTLTAISPYGCEVKLQKNIFFISSKESDFDAALDSCSGVYNFYNVTQGAAFYHWDFGDGSTSEAKTPSYKFAKDGEHFVKLTVNGESQCADSVGKVINYESPLGEKLFIPNSFTPNGDGLNDLFSMSVYRPCDIYKLSIYNRWGQKVFEVSDASGFIWDGTFNGEKLAEDVYVYLLENNNTIRQGTITILR
jgi:gliding motility-associated-like protein